MTAPHAAGPSVEDLTVEDVYHAVAGDPDARGGIYLDRVIATGEGLAVTLSDDLDRSVTYTLTVATPVADDEAGQLLAERYGNLGRLLAEAARC